jgi:DNA-binding transcriptional LysR family regulator
MTHGLGSANSAAESGARRLPSARARVACPARHAATKSANSLVRTWAEARNAPGCPAGTVLARYAESVLATLEEASAALAATRNSLTGRLRIGAYPSAARTILPPALVALGGEHPGLELMVTELDPVAVPGALHAGTLDVALTFVYDYVPAEPDPALETEPLLEESLYLATAAATASGQSGHAGIQALVDAPWIAGSPDTLCHTMVIRACQASGFTPRIRHHADDFATVLALVAAGQGVSLIPQLGATETPDGVRLTPMTARRRTSMQKGNQRPPRHRGVRRRDPRAVPAAGRGRGHDLGRLADAAPLKIERRGVPSAVKA